MSIPLEELAAQALAARRQAIRAYDGVRNVEALEAMRARATEEGDREVLDKVILIRRRQEKGAWEELVTRADLYDKASIPLAAALPVFVTFLGAEHVLVDPVRFGLLLTAYLFGGFIWLASRWASFKYGARAKRGLARLGKVE
jgi:hypothetical protein